MLGGPPFAESLQPVATKVARLEDTFQGIDFLVGGVWVSDSDESTAAEEVTVGLDGKFLIATKSIVLGGGAAATFLRAFLSVHPQTGRLLLWNFTSSGAYAEAEQIRRSSGRVWRFKGRTVASKTVTWHLKLTQTGEDSLAVKTRLLEGPGKPFEATYVRR